MDHGRPGRTVHCGTLTGQEGGSWPFCPRLGLESHSPSSSFSQPQQPLRSGRRTLSPRRKFSSHSIFKLILSTPATSQVRKGTLSPLTVKSHSPSSSFSQPQQPLRSGRWTLSPPKFECHSIPSSSFSQLQPPHRSGKADPVPASLPRSPPLSKTLSQPPPLRSGRWTLSPPHLNSHSIFKQVPLKLQQPLRSGRRTLSPPQA